MFGGPTVKFSSNSLFHFISCLFYEHSISLDVLQLHCNLLDMLLERFRLFEYVYLSVLSTEVYTLLGLQKDNKH